MTSWHQKKNPPRETVRKETHSVDMIFPSLWKDVCTQIQTHPRDPPIGRAEPGWGPIGAVCNTRNAWFIGKMVGAPWDGTLKNQPHIHLKKVGIYWSSVWQSRSKRIAHKILRFFCSLGSLVCMASCQFSTYGSQCTINSCRSTCPMEKQHKSPWWTPSYDLSQSW